MRINHLSLQTCFVIAECSDVNECIKQYALSFSYVCNSAMLLIPSLSVFFYLPSLRSILNVIQEKQAEQDRDIAMLKDELQVLRTSQETDHATLEKASIMVSDAAWAIRDLKHSQDQLHSDFMTFKKSQEEQNETVRELEGENCIISVLNQN